MFEDKQKSIQFIIENVYCPARYYSRRKFIYVDTRKENDENWYECHQCKACRNVSYNSFEDQKPSIMLFGES